MKFEHRIVIAATVEAVAAFLEDVPAVARCVPGVEEVGLVSPDAYEGRIRLRLGPVGFTLSGTARLDRSEDRVWRLHGEGRDRRIGAGVGAALEARLAPETPASTQLHVVADLQFSGRLAELGQPLIRHKADSMVREFADNVRQVLESAG